MNLTDDELLLSANKEIKRLESIITNYLDNNYSKNYIIDSRIKTLDKMKLKQELFLKRDGISFKISELPDIIGFRIAVDTEEDVVKLHNLLKDHLKPFRVMDYFNNPKSSGFKAYLQHFETFEVNTEIQIMTVDMREWSNKTHEEYDKNKYSCIYEH